MAERRMFAKTIIDSDAFLDMPMSSQNLYFHLSMRADDDGFINNPKKLQRMLGATDDDLKILVAKSFVIMFESGIIVIKHWRISNYLRSDRYKPTVYNDEKAQLEVKENGAYHKIGIPCVNQPVYQVVDERETQVSIGKVSIGKDKVKDEQFNEFWNQYPKKVSKTQAERTFNALMKKGIEVSEIIHCLINYLEEIRSTGKEMQYIKNPSTFLNNYLDYANKTTIVYQDQPKARTCPKCSGTINNFGFCKDCKYELPI